MSANNQDPFIEKYDASGTRLWRNSYANSPADERATLVTQNPVNGQIWAVFTTDGGNSNFGSLNATGSPFGDAPFRSYGSGGGPKVSVLARIDPTTGNMVDATYLLARLNSGRTNTLTVREINFDASGNVVLVVNSYYRPPAVGSSQNSWRTFAESALVAHNGGGFAVRITLDGNLSQIIASDILPADYVYGSGTTTLPVDPGFVDTGVRLSAWASPRSASFARTVETLSLRGNSSAEEIEVAIVSFPLTSRQAVLDHLSGFDQAQATRDVMRIERPHTDAISQRLRARQLGLVNDGLDASRFSLFNASAASNPNRDSVVAAFGGRARSPDHTGSFGRMPASSLAGFGMFISGDVATLDRKSTASRVGLNNRGTAITIGGDYRFDRGTLAGLAFGYQTDKAKLSGSQSQLDRDLYEIYAYGSTMFGRVFYVDAVAGAGWGELESRRAVFSALARGKADMTTAQAKIAVGAVLDDLRVVVPQAPAELYVVPEVALKHSYARLDRFEEQGVENFNLGWGRRISSLLTTEVTSTFGYRSEMGRASFALWTKLGLANTYAFSGRTTHAWIVGSPGDTFRLVSAGSSPNAFLVSLGGDIAFRGGLQIGASYETRLGVRDTQAQRFSGRVSLPF